MIRIRNFLIAGSLLLIVACGESPESTGPAVAPPPAEATAAESTAAESVTEGDAAVAESPAPTPTEPVIVEESAAEGEEVDIVLTEAQAATTAAKAATPVPQKYPEGQFYSVLTAAQGTTSSPDVIEVAEVFWYGCPHCYNFDPFVTKWSEKLDSGVAFVRLPVMWNPTNQIHARMFYTADALGKLDEMHIDIFKEMHNNKNMLASEAAIEDFFVSRGVSSEDFQKTFRSFSVESKLKRAQNLTQRYQIRSVPLLVINGKYVTTGDGIRNFDDMLGVADQLISMEKAEL